jgi:hypothetical protein
VGSISVPGIDLCFKIIVAITQRVPIVHSLTHATVASAITLNCWLDALAGHLLILHGNIGLKLEDLFYYYGHIVCL